ncbi:LPS translocon maturation chaperone LptM [Acinetobacter terrae]|uniref:Lipoprotein n=1 Tax=Acinetobacter terrae TaxID=2731247 RepID=A0A8E4GME9_9GAMM|nr:lipoprotein [Acinetobacter terrae]NNH39616.1 lipoprotein [Acinetobacter terrae]NNH88520.1 lipoprotein [Acinetobacter terrae]
MRLVICYISLLATGFALVGCGQSGALQLPSDQNYDKRSKYLLYPNVDSKQQSEQKEASEQKPFVAPTESNQPSTP